MKKKTDIDFALMRTCPVCQASPGEPCSVPTDRTRRPVAWYHLDREFDHGEG